MGLRLLPALVGVLLALSGCSIGCWYAIHPTFALFVAPGATNISITRLGWNVWQLGYHATGAPTTWSTDVGQQLEVHHWNGPDKAAYGALTRTYSRATQFGACELWVWAYLTFDPLQPQKARSIVRWEIVLPWWQSLTRSQQH